MLIYWYLCLLWVSGRKIEVGESKFSAEEQPVLTDEAGPVCTEEAMAEIMGGERGTNSSGSKPRGTF